MSRTIRHIETLDYCNIPEVFSGEDQLGCLYLCFVQKDLPEGYLYLCAPSTLQDINNFKFGKISLRNLFLNSKTNEFYTCIIDDYTNEAIPLDAYLGVLNDDVLPGENYILDYCDTDVDTIYTKSEEEGNIKCPLTDKKFGEEKVTFVGEVIRIRGIVLNIAKNVFSGGEGNNDSGTVLTLVT